MSNSDPKSSNSAKTTSKGSVLQSAMAMSAGTMSSRILGLIRDMLMSSFFPTMITDAFFAAFKLPNLFRRLLGEGALSASFIPIYVGLNHEKGLTDAKQLSGSLWSILMAVTAALSVLGVIFMEQLIPIMLGGDGYVSVPGKLELTIYLGKVMFSYLFLVTSYAFLMAVANAHKYFLVPALGPTLFNFIFIMSELLSRQLNIIDGSLVAYGVLIGGMFQVSLVLFFLLKKGFLPKLKWNFKAPGLVKVLQNMVPGMLGLGVVQLMSIANLRFASELPEGSISYIYYGDRILELPQSLIAISLGSALLPTLSKLWVEGNKKLFLQESLRYQKILLYMALPCCAGLFVLAKPIVEVLFQSTNFLGNDIMGTVTVLQIYSFLLLASSLNKILVPNLYAIKNTWLPALITVISLTVHILLAPQLLKSMGLQGLILSMTLAGFLNMTMVFLSCQKLVGRTSVVDLLASFLKVTGMALLMGVVVYYCSQGLYDSLDSKVIKSIYLFILIFIGILTYGLLSYLFKIEEFNIVKKIIKRR